MLCGHYQRNKCHSLKSIICKSFINITYITIVLQNRVQKTHFADYEFGNILKFTTCDRAGNRHLVCICREATLFHSSQPEADLVSSSSPVLSLLQTVFQRLLFQDGGVGGCPLSTCTFSNLFLSPQTCVLPSSFQGFISLSPCLCRISLKPPCK